MFRFSIAVLDQQEVLFWWAMLRQSHFSLPSWISKKYYFDGPCCDSKMCAPNHVILASAKSSKETTNSIAFIAKRHCKKAFIPQEKSTPFLTYAWRFRTVRSDRRSQNKGRPAKHEARYRGPLIGFHLHPVDVSNLKREVTAMSWPFLSRSDGMSSSFFQQSCGVRLLRNWERQDAHVAM